MRQVWRWMWLWLVASLLAMTSSLAMAATITSISPASGPAGTQVTITGSGFTGTYGVYFDSGLQPATFTVVNDTTITATAPSGVPLGPSDVDVDAPSGYVWLQSAFTYTAGSPPVANPVSATVAYGSTGNPITLNITGGTPTGVAVGTAPAHGTAVPSGTSITYSPTAGYAGPDSFTYTASNANGTSAPATVTITVSPPTITYTPTSPAGGTAGVAYSQSVAGASGGSGSYTYTVAAGALPAGLTLGANGTISGTPTTGGTFNFTVRAMDSSTGTGPFSATSGTLTLTVGAAAITLSPTSLTAGTVGIAYSQTLSTAGGTAPYTYSITAGALPAGMTLSTGGVLSGTPTAGGTFNFTVTALDSSTGSGPYTGSRAYTLTVNAPSIFISPASLSLPNGTAGTAYSQTFIAGGGTSGYTYTVDSGALPAGLSLSTGGVLSGTPTASGSFSFTVKARDSSTGTGPYEGTRTYSLNVSSATLSLSPASGALSAAVGTAFSQSFTAAGGIAPYSYSINITSGTMPAGLSFNSATGTLSGTPTTAGGVSFTVTATDSTGGSPATVSGNYSLTATAPTITLTPSTLPNGAAGVAYSQTLTASGGGSGGYTYSVTAGALPAGLTLSGNVISGTPTAVGTFNFTVQARDNNSFTGSQAYSIVIASPILAMSPAPGTLNATAGAAFSQTFSASGGTAPYTYSLNVTSGSMPAGLSFNAGTATLSGTPTTAGTVSFTVTATDSTGGTTATVSNSYTLTTGAPTITLTPSTLPSGAAGVAYSQTLTASGGGSGGYTYSVTAGLLPAGLTLAGSAISGTPTAAGTFNFTVQARDNNSFTGSQAYSIVIGAPGIALTPTTLPGPAAGIAYSQTITASGGNGPYTFSATGILPTGLTLSPGGVLSGTPAALTAGQVYSFTVRATDSTTGTGAPYSATQVYNFTVAQGVPTAQPARVSTQPGVPVTIDVATGASGAPFTGVVIVAAPASGSTTTSGTAITYTPAANTLGEVTFDYTLSNATGPSLPVRVTVDVGVIPVALAQRPLTAVSGRSARIELTEGATGGPFTGAALVSLSPADAGTVTITPTAGKAPASASLLPAAPAPAGSGYTLEFVPAAAFGGTATILYTLSNSTTTSAPGQITVSVTPRRDPSTDPDVVGLINAQVQAARRFATTQISNYNQRLEALHGTGRAPSQNNLSVVLPTRQMDAAQRCAEIVGLRARNACLTGAEAGRMADINAGITSGMPLGTDAGMPAPDGFLRTAYRPGTPTGTFRTLAAAQTRAARAQDRAQGLPDLPGHDAVADPTASDLAFWSAGMLDFGFANSGTQRAGFRFTTGGITAGADYRVSDQVSVGGGFGYARDSTDIGSAGTHSSGDSYSLALYGSFRPTPAYFIDGVAGLGTLSFDSRRWVNDANAFATGKRDGRQWFASVSAGYEYRNQAWLISPYGRLSVTETRLDRFSERGADYHALTYFDQTVTSLAGTLGLRAEYAQQVRWGMLLPFMRVEYQRDLNGESAARITYADFGANDPFYTVRGSAFGRDRMQIGLGAKLNTGTLSFGLDYNVMFGMGGLQQGVRLSFVAPF
ncbi:putative Ig domain-containing protein [Imbroritus primus]|uniref:putative Ig domain-containing protein n=1 Tax=Imbroritus primus TaxID=3058603 RepID=UPI003D1605E7